MNQKDIKELAELRNKAILAIKEYNLIAMAKNCDSRLMLADCELESYTDYTKHYELAEETKIIVKDWSSSTEQCEGGYGSSDEQWNNSGCSF